MLDQEREFFERKRAEWLAAHEGKYVLVHGQQLISMHNDQKDAIAEGVSRFGLTPFLVRQIQASEEEVSIPVLMLGLLGAHLKSTTDCSPATA